MVSSEASPCLQRAAFSVPSRVPPWSVCPLGSDLFFKRYLSYRVSAALTTSFYLNYPFKDPVISLVDESQSRFQSYLVAAVSHILSSHFSCILLKIWSSFLR